MTEQQQQMARALLGVSFTQAVAELESGEIAGTPAGEVFRQYVALLSRLSTAEARIKELETAINFCSGSCSHSLRAGGAASRMDCPNAPDPETGEWPCDPKGYFGVMECQVCGRVGVLQERLERLEDRDALQSKEKP